MLEAFRRTAAMDDEEFAEFERNVVAPMIRRHEKMFPRMHGRAPADSLPFGPIPRPHLSMPTLEEKPAMVDRYAPCSCGSGKKYKFCCGKKGR